MPPTVTNIGHAPVPAGLSSKSFPAYNQPAGHCIVVATATYANAANDLSSVTDTAGNTYVVALGPITDIFYQFRILYAKNCLGNSSNVITANYFAPSQCCSTIFAWDVAGVDALNPLDVATSAGSSSNSPSTLIATAYPNEAIIAFNAIVSGYATASAGAGFIFDGNDGDGGDEAAGEHAIFSSVQPSLSVAMSLNVSAPWRLGVVSFADKGAAAAAAGQRTLLGVGV